MKLVNEKLEDILKPKSREEIEKGIKDLDLQNLDPVVFYDRYYLNQNQLPPEFLPLIGQIHHDISKKPGVYCSRNIAVHDFGSMGRHIEFNAKINGRRIYVSQNEGQKDIIFKIYPFKKIRKLKHLRLVNNYMIENFEQYEELIKHL